MLCALFDAIFELLFIGFLRSKLPPPLEEGDARFGSATQTKLVQEMVSYVWRNGSNFGHQLLRRLVLRPLRYPLKLLLSHDPLSL